MDDDELQRILAGKLRDHYDEEFCRILYGDPDASPPPDVRGESVITGLERVTREQLDVLYGRGAPIHIGIDLATERDTVSVVTLQHGRILDASDLTHWSREHQLREIKRTLAARRPKAKRTRFYCRTSAADIERRRAANRAARKARRKGR